MEGETGEHQESNKEQNNESSEKESEGQLPLKKFGESGKELESIFIQKLKELRRSNIEEIQPRGKLEKLKMPTVIQESSEQILGKYLLG